MKKSLAVLMVCGIALSTIGLPRESVSADPKPSAHHHSSSCAEVCAMCANACSSCVEHCVLQLALGKKEHATTLRLCNDCADLCSLTAKIGSRGGPLNLLICEACAKACDRCAAECNQFKDQPHMVQCAKACMDCASGCREMIQHVEHSK